MNAMENVIIVLTTFVMGMISGPIVLILAAMKRTSKKPKTKEEWKEEGAMDL